MPPPPLTRLMARIKTHAWRLWFATVSQPGATQEAIAKRREQNGALMTMYARRENDSGFVAWVRGNQPHLLADDAPLKKQYADRPDEAARAMTPAIAFMHGLVGVSPSTGSDDGAVAVTQAAVQREFEQAFIQADMARNPLTQSAVVTAAAATAAMVSTAMVSTRRRPRQPPPPPAPETQSMADDPVQLSSPPPPPPDDFDMAPPPQTNALMWNDDDDGGGGGGEDETVVVEETGVARTPQMDDVPSLPRVGAFQASFTPMPPLNLYDAPQTPPDMAWLLDSTFERSYPFPPGSPFDHIHPSDAPLRGAINSPIQPFQPGGDVRDAPRTPPDAAWSFEQSLQAAFPSPQVDRAMADAPRTPPDAAWSFEQSLQAAFPSQQIDRAMADAPVMMPPDHHLSAGAEPASEAHRRRGAFSDTRGDTTFDRFNATITAAKTPVPSPAKTPAVPRTPATPVTLKLPRSPGMPRTPPLASRAAMSRSESDRDIDDMFSVPINAMRKRRQGVTVAAAAAASASASAAPVPVVVASASAAAVAFARPPPAAAASAANPFSLRSSVDTSMPPVAPIRPKRSIFAASPSAMQQDDDDDDVQIISATVARAPPAARPVRPMVPVETIHQTIASLLPVRRAPAAAAAAQPTIGTWHNLAHVVASYATENRANVELTAEILGAFATSRPVLPEVERVTNAFSARIKNAQASMATPEFRAMVARLRRRISRSLEVVTAAPASAPTPDAAPGRQHKKAKKTHTHAEMPPPSSSAKRGRQRPLAVAAAAAAPYIPRPYVAPVAPAAAAAAGPITRSLAAPSVPRAAAAASSSSSSTKRGRQRSPSPPEAEAADWSHLPAPHMPRICIRHGCAQPIDATVVCPNCMDVDFALYCSKACLAAHAADHEMLCQATQQEQARVEREEAEAEAAAKRLRKAKSRSRR